MFAGPDSKLQYPTFYSMVPSDRNLHNARFRFLNNFNWTRVGTIKQSDEPRYALVGGINSKAIHQLLMTVLFL